MVLSVLQLWKLRHRENIALAEVLTPVRFSSPTILVPFGSGLWLSPLPVVLGLSDKFPEFVHWGGSHTLNSHDICLASLNSLLLLEEI